MSIRPHIIHFKHADTKTLLGLVAVIIAIAVAAHSIRPAYADSVTLLACSAAIIGVQLDRYRRRREDDETTRRHQQAVTYLYSTLNVRRALPPHTGWAASPELCGHILDTIRAHRPETIVEVGGGVSSVVVGYALHEQEHGYLISLDHMDEYAAITRRRLSKHRLDDVVEVRHAPLTDVTIEGKSWPWYDLSVIDDLDTIDLLIIDGPPEQTRPQARYPAVPALHDRLSDDAVVILDDAYRPDETAIVERWQAADPRWTLTLRESPDGTAILHRSG